jgi:hypothetical protein
MRKYLSSRDAAGLWILSMAFFLGYCAGSSRAAAQELELVPIVLTPELALARICASEADIQITDDCAAIHQVLVRGARTRHIDFVTYAVMYADSVFDGSGSRPWLMELDEEGSRPSRWPRMTHRRVGGHIEVRPNTSWEGTYRARWLRLLGHARRIVAGHVRSACVLPPDHWGSPTLYSDRHRADRAMAQGVWVQIACGDTRNSFYRIAQ